MKIAVGLLFYLLVAPSNGRADAPKEGEFFQVSGVSHFCYQTMEEAESEGRRRMQEEAESLCGSVPAIKWQELKRRLFRPCGMEQKAIYVCSSSPVCMPRMYWIQCCDQKGCWAE